LIPKPQGGQYARNGGSISPEYPNVQNPSDQARRNGFALQNGLMNDSRMLNKDGKHIGKLVTPVNFGYVLTNMSSQDIVEANLKHNFPLEKMLDQEFVKGYAYTDRDIEIALERLRGRAKFLPVLEQDQMNAINEFLGTPVVIDPVTSKVVGVFDETQERLACFKIDKQILIEGPAGSGKSLILVKRAVYLQERHPEWEIGIFCFNAVMANFLQLLLEQEMPGHHFLVSHLQSIFPITPDIPRLDAILVDEGQDLKESDLRELFILLKKPESPFTIFYDTRQSLYCNLDISEAMEKIGFKIENQKELVRQQRSVHVVIALAFHEAMLNNQLTLDNILLNTNEVAKRYFHGFENHVTAISSGVSRHFSKKDELETQISLQGELSERVSLIQKDNPYKMIEDFAALIKEKVDPGEASYHDFMIIYPTRFLNFPLPTSIKNRLSVLKIPFRIIDTEKYGKKGYCCTFPDFNIIEEGDNRHSSNLNDNLVKAMTAHQAKGLDAKYVAVLGFENIFRGLDEENEIQNNQDDNNEYKHAADLGYVSLTRAKEACYIYYIKKNKAVEVLEQIIEGFSKQEQEVH
jgi:superfamily I DNA/RNA helicase